MMKFWKPRAYVFRAVAAMFMALAGFACADSESRRLIGHWQAISILEEEERPLRVNPEEIRFHFFENRTYAYESTLNYREAGHYSVRSRYLLTRDTIRPESREKAVEILQLGADTLQLRMLDRGRERQLTLVRTQ